MLKCWATKFKIQWLLTHCCICRTRVPMVLSSYRCIAGIRLSWDLKSILDNYLFKKWQYEIKHWNYRSYFLKPPKCWGYVHCMHILRPFLRHFATKRVSRYPPVSSDKNFKHPISPPPPHGASTVHDEIAAQMDFRGGNRLWADYGRNLSVQPVLWAGVCRMLRPLDNFCVS